MKARKTTIVREGETWLAIPVDVVDAAAVLATVFVVVDGVVVDATAAVLSLPVINDVDIGKFGPPGFTLRDEVLAAGGLMADDSKLAAVSVGLAVNGPEPNSACSKAHECCHCDICDDTTDGCTKLLPIMHWPQSEMVAMMLCVHRHQLIRIGVSTYELRHCADMMGSLVQAD